VRPVTAAVEDHQLVPTLGLAELGSVIGGCDANAFVVYQRAARVAGESNTRKPERHLNNESRGEKDESQFHT